MNKNLSFNKRGWKEYLYWQTQDKKTLKKINDLREALQRDNQEIIGKAEKLNGELSGLCSMRINSKDRLVYRVKDNEIQILQCKSHYDE